MDGDAATVAALRVFDACHEAAADLGARFGLAPDGDGSVQMIHVPNHRMGCFSLDAAPRMWADKNGCKPMTPEEIEKSRWCGAFRDKEQRLFIQGDSCEGCARIREEHR